MKNAKLSIGIVAVLVLMSFKSTEKETIKSGAYGVCHCGDAATKSSKVELLINDDNTFHYFNNSDPSNKVDVKGKWEMKDNTIRLHDYDSETAIHNKWAIDKNENCLKSRKGLYFMRLCYLNACKK
mgnify:CR=1 FL=1|tara:strand:- start:435 stop:812 length:378 start_codon:yes stop_codon:yes gene_type:complete